MKITLSSNNRKISENAKFYLWGYKGQTFSLSELLSILDEDFRKGIFKTICIKSNGFSEEGKEEFIEGFLSTVTNVYSFDEDTKTDCPWCTPWIYSSSWGDNFCIENPKEMGIMWAHINEDEITKLFSDGVKW